MNLLKKDDFSYFFIDSINSICYQLKQLKPLTMEKLIMRSILFSFILFFTFISDSRSTCYTPNSKGVADTVIVITDYSVYIMNIVNFSWSMFEDPKTVFFCEDGLMKNVDIGLGVLKYKKEDVDLNSLLIKNIDFN